MKLFLHGIISGGGTWSRERRERRVKTPPPDLLDLLERNDSMGN